MNGLQIGKFDEIPLGKGLKFAWDAARNHESTVAAPIASVLVVGISAYFADALGNHEFLKEKWPLIAKFAIAEGVAVKAVCGSLCAYLDKKNSENNKSEIVPCR